MMTFFTARSDKPKESAADVRKAYASDINKFLNKVDSHKFFRRRHDALDSLFSWGDGILEQNEQLKIELNRQKEEIRESQDRIGDLSHAYAIAQSKVEELSKTNDKIEKEYSDELAEITKQYSKRLEEKERDHNDEIAALKRDNENTRVSMGKEIRVKDREHAFEQERLKSHHETQILTHKEKNKRLVQQLLVNQDPNLAWPDDKLKFHYKELQRLVDSVIRKALASKNQHFGLQSDPTGFLKRVGDGKARFLLKSTIWNILKDQFFSVPYGFGALGPGTAHQEIMNIYLTWKKGFECQDEPGLMSSNISSLSTETFAIFQHNKLANNWRSSTFQCINSELLDAEKQDPQKETPLQTFRRDNLRQTTNRIKSALSNTSQISDNSLSGDVEEEIQRISDLALKVGLQFGVNPARLLLPIPEHGESVQIGEQFHESINADLNIGNTLIVDLVTLPGLQKIIDTNSDPDSKRVIVACEVYPMA